MAKYVVMVRDELGECERAFGSPNLEREYTYPSIDWDNELDVEMFYTWQSALEQLLQEEWEKLFGPESIVFLERKFSDMSLGEWGRLGYDTSI